MFAPFGTPHNPSFNLHMAMRCIPALFYFLILILLQYQKASTHAAVLPTAVSVASACTSSIYPNLCQDVLRPLPTPSSMFDYAQYTVDQALDQTRQKSELLESYLAPEDVSRTGREVLEECRYWTVRSMEFLESVKIELAKGESSLTAKEIQRLKALMSAVLTNHQTCVDALEESKAFPELSAAASTETRLLSISLELVTSALERNLWRHAGGGSRSEEHRSGSTTGLPTTNTEAIRVPVSQTVTVAKHGKCNFTSIREAVAYAPNITIDDGYFVIFIDEGVYKENIVIASAKKNIMLIGAGVNQTIITGNRSVVDGWPTFKTATFIVESQYFIAMDITFVNSAGPEKHQAVAVRNSADRSIFYRCSFIGFQDTLYVHSLRQFYRDCDVYGTVDFIFGNAAAVLQNCNIYPRKPLRNQYNVITAQGRTHPNQTTGISIHNCTIHAAPGFYGHINGTKTFLGRPWKEYSRTVYMQSFIDSLVQPAGWKDWNGTFALSTLYYGEFENYGRGAYTGHRVHWPGYTRMNATEAKKFTVSRFIDGDDWLPYSSISYSGGLLCLQEV